MTESPWMDKLPPSAPYLISTAMLTRPTIMVAPQMKGLADKVAINERGTLQAKTPKELIGMMKGWRSEDRTSESSRTLNVTLNAQEGKI